MLDFSNRDFAFFEFPDGVDLDIYDDDNNKSNVIADYALVYAETDLIDLRGNVVLRTHNNDTLFAEQLYYDQKTEWLFTNQPVRFRTKNEIINGNGFDSNRNFTNAEVLETTGIIYIDE
jgi:LPS export ABC transporter protein LptC